MARRAKPYGVQSLMLFIAVTDGPCADPARATRMIAVGRTPFGVTFDHAEDGKVATYFARWMSARRDEGPLANPVSMRIAA